MSAGTIKDGFNGGSDNQALVDNAGNLHVYVANPGGGGGTTTDVNVHDGSGNPIGSTSGALNVYSTGSSTVTGTVTTEQAGLNAFQTSQYVVGTSAIQIATPALANRSSVSLRVIASANQAIYIGQDASLTTSNGYPLYNGDTLQMDLTPANNIYAIATAAGQTICILEIA